MAIGIFLHYPNAGYLEEARNVLNGLKLDIQEIKADYETVSNLVPYTLQRGAESWLILFAPDYQRDLLILPFPDKSSEVQEGFLGSIIEELPRVIDMFLSRNFRFSLDWNRRFQYVHIDVSVYSLLNSRRGQQQDRQTPQQIVHFCQATSQNIQTERNKAWRRAQEKGNPIVLDQFDKVLETANHKIFERIIAQGSKKVVPEIVNIFEDIMDPETKRFLITTETVSAFVDKHLPPNFDYSAPGCGLWKAVERELNLSLVLHLRREAGVVKNVYYPWKGSKQGKIPILTGENRSVDLNKDSKNPDSIMLGPMTSLLEWGHCNTVREKLENLFFAFDFDFDFLLQYLLGQHAGAGGSAKKDTLPEFLDKIRKLRNGHAHISAMSRQEFGTLRNLVLASKHGATSSCLHGILLLKALVLLYWGQSDFPTKITTEDKQVVEFKNYNNTFTRGDGSNWKLVAIHGDGSELCIATFDTKDDAEAVRKELDKAAGTEKEWDVNRFKEKM